MITILKNINFGNWFDIKIFGELVDNATSEAEALRIARRLKRSEYPQFQIQIINED